MMRGVLLLLLSALAFTLSTVFAKLVNQGSQISGIEVSFFRFLTGFIVVSLYLLRGSEKIRPNNCQYVLMRAGFNTIAVLLFFTGIQYTTVTNANMLNMTYPAFVFILAPFINREKGKYIHILFLALTFGGTYLIIFPDFNTVNPGDVYAFLSAVAAGFALTSLREARKHDSSATILFHLMMTGTIVSFCMMLPTFIVPRGMTLFFLISSAVVAVIGQGALTIGFKYINAAPGSLVSSSRILFAVTLGVIIFGDPLNAHILWGGILILISLIGTSRIWEWFSKSK